MPGHSIWTRYSYAWVTLGFFLISLIGHWLFGWFAFAEEQRTHGEVPEFGPYFIEMMRDTLENWQSEFLQLIWQVAGLAILLHVGSPQSKEGSDRVEAKVDEILKRVAPKKEGEKIISELDEAYAGRHTDPQHKQRAERRE
jgi:hypothetical protein